MVTQNKSKVLGVANATENVAEILFKLLKNGVQTAQREFYG